MNLIFGWGKNASRYGHIDPQEAGDEIERIGHRFPGRSLPESVVEAAAAQDHIFHDVFEWNDERAGAKYREIQATKLIQAIVIRRERKKPPPKTVSVRTRRARPPEKLATFSVVRESPSEPLLLDQAIRELRKLHRRYAAVPEIKEGIRVLLVDLEHMRRGRKTA